MQANTQNLEIDESYWFEGQSYSCRRQFYSPSNEQTLFPEIKTTIRFSPNLAPTFYDAVKRFLLRAKERHQKLHILYSGGVDSEILLSVAIQEKIPFVAVVVDLFAMNSYDLFYAREFLEQNDVSEILWFEVSKEEFNAKWLPEFVFESESLSFLMTGGYIAARSCPPNSAIVWTGEKPESFCCQDNTLYFLRHECSLWPKKFQFLRNQKLYESFADTGVIKSFLSSPTIYDRLTSYVPFRNWYAEHDYAGKEFFYSDPRFQSIRRRYSQHGWEPMAGYYSFKKGMFPFHNSPKEVWNTEIKKPFNLSGALTLLLNCLASNELDYELAKSLLFDGAADGRPAPEYSRGPLESHFFNQQLFVPFGKLEDGKLIWNE